MRTMLAERASSQSDATDSFTHHDMFHNMFVYESGLRPVPWGHQKWNTLDTLAFIHSQHQQQTDGPTVPNWPLTDPSDIDTF